MFSAKTVNISASGVAVAYESGQNLCYGDKVSVDILYSGPTNLMVIGLRCKSVYDFQSLSENSSYQGTLSRQCGLAFLAPSELQQDQLIDLMANLL